MTMDPGFDLRWKRNPKPQATTAGVLWQKTGWRPEDLKGKLVLDAGCGIGRFSAVAAAAGAQVVGMDASHHALEAARVNVPGALFVEADLLDMPVGSFPEVDRAFSMGVLHHTADPAKAFSEVASMVRIGGEFAVWVYCKPAADDRTLAAMEFLHDICRACPPEALYAACERHAVKLRDIYAGAWGPLEQALRASVSPDDAECISDTFDWHAPQYRFWHTEAEVRGWFENAGYEVKWTGKFPVSMRGRRVR